MERGPKGGYEAGQPIIDTDEAMNDTPKNAVDNFVDRMQKRVADGTYTQEEADALIEKAKARHEEKEEAAANEAAYNAWANMTPAEATQKSDDFANNFAGESEEGQNRNGDFALYPRQAGESNEEYGARLRKMHEATKQYQEENPVQEEPAEKTAMDTYREMVEKRVENGDLKREDADAMIAKREAQYGEMQEAKAEAARNDEAFLNFDEAQEKAKMEMAERIRKEVPEALEFLEKHPELKTEMAAAVKKLEELEEIAKIEGDAKNALDAELAHRNEAFMSAVEAFNAAARANEAARAKMDEFEKKGTGTDAEYQVILDEIHKTEDDMKAADANKKNAESEYNAAEAAIREDAEKRTGELRDRMEERDKYVAEERDYYNEHFMEAQADYQIAKNANEAARAKMKELEAKGASDEEFQACEDEIHATEKAMAEAKAKMDEFKQDQVDAADVMEEWVDRGLGKKPAGEGAGAEAGAAEGAAAEAGAGEDAGKGGEADSEKEEFEKFFNDYFNDPDFRAIYTRNGVFDEESCRIAIKNMYDAKKANEAKEAGAAEGAAAEAGTAAEGEDGEYEYTDEDFEGLDEDFENEEQKGLFAKIKGFFNRNKRVKDGSKKEVKNWRKKALVGVLAFMLGAQIANFLGSSGILNKNKEADDTGSEVETEATSNNENEENPTLEDIAENLSLEVDLNAEKGEELTDMIHGKVEGVETDLSVSAGEWSGVDAYFDENKTSTYAIGSPVYDREHMSEMSRFEISKAGFEGIAERLDNPGVLAQWTALFAGGDLVYHDDNGNDIKGINSRDDLNHLLRIIQDDDVARQYFADFCKQEYANLGEKYEVRSRTIEVGETYTSTYILNMASEGEQPRMIYFIDWECTADKQKNEMYFVDENGANIMDKNEIGGIKYNVMKSLGLIGEDATDEEAIAIMEKYEFRGMLLDCGGAQPDIRLIIPDTGEEKTGSETGKETEETGKETEETGKETEETGTEKETEETGTEKETEETGTEKETEETGTEKETAETGTEKETEETGTEKETAETGTEKETAETGTEKETIETGTEKETAETGTEKETDETGDGKTDILPGDEDDGWDIIDQPTQEETGPTSEADRIPVDEGGNGYVNDETPGSSSGLHEDDFLNGGDQGGGNTDADGGGSTNPDTEATYDGSETGGWQGETPSEEQGTQTIDEPSTQEEVNAINDSEANPDSAGEDQAPGEGRDAAMDRLG